MSSFEKFLAICSGNTEKGSQRQGRKQEEMRKWRSCKPGTQDAEKRTVHNVATLLILFRVSLFPSFLKKVGFSTNWLNKFSTKDQAQQREKGASVQSLLKE